MRDGCLDYSRRNGSAHGNGIEDHGGFLPGSGRDYRAITGTGFYRKQLARGRTEVGVHGAIEDRGKYYHSLPYFG